MVTLIRFGYKMTEYSEIPEYWKVESLDNMIEILDTMRVPLSETERANKKGTIPYCGANGIIDYIDDYIFDDEAVLIAEDGGNYGKFQNKAYIMTGKYWVNNHAHIFRGRTELLENKFIMQWFNFSDIRPYISGSTRTKLNQEMLKRILVPVPSLQEQKKIAEILFTTDETIQRVNVEIALAEKLKQGLMQILLTKGIGHTKFKITEIGEIPEEWCVKMIQEYANVKYGRSNPKTKGTIPLIGSSGAFGTVGEALIPTPTIVIGRKGTAGAVWDIKTPSWPSDTSFYLEYKKEISQKFLFEFMSLNKLTGENAKTTLPSVKKEEIEKFLFPLPPIIEQQKIADILSIVDYKLELLGNKKAKLEKVKRGLMGDLLTGKIRVKLNTSKGED